MKLIKSSPVLIVVGVMLLVTVGIVSASNNRWTLPESATPDTNYPHLPACNKYKLTDDDGNINTCAYYKNEVEVLNWDLNNQKEEVARLTGIVAARDAELGEMAIESGKHQRISTLISRGCVHYGNGKFSGTVGEWEVKCVRLADHAALYKVLKRDEGATITSYITIKRKAYGDTEGEYEYQVEGRRWFWHAGFKPASTEVRGRWDIHLVGRRYFGGGVVGWVDGRDCRKSVAVTSDLTIPAACNQAFWADREFEPSALINATEYEYMDALLRSIPVIFGNSAGE